MRIYSSQTRGKREFKSIEAGRVRMYVCGPTVYDNAHIGNARTFIVFDVIRRWLIASGYEVIFVQNLTDVDDRIINRARERDCSAEQVAHEFSDRFIDVMRRANVLDPDVRPRATREIEPMIEMIEGLVEQGHAYAPGNGDVYFSVRSDPTYGEVSGRDIDELMVGARIEENTEKRDPLDFALWKAAKCGEPSWESPWGPGRPGWHTECAAMVHRYLGCPIDIHGGGSDLVFPHHENECAQAVCCWHEGFANIWMHAGMLTVDGEKMSKSLGNFFTLDEVLARHSAAALRLLMLQTHYRTPLDFSFERLAGAESSLARVAGAIANLSWASAHAHSGAGREDDLAVSLLRAVGNAEAEFAAQMNDDFNTAGALAAIFTLVTDANTYLERAGAAVCAHVVDRCARVIEQSLTVLGIEVPARAASLPIELVERAARLVGYVGDDVDAAAEAMLAARARARADRDWARADAIRDELGELGLSIEDTAAGSRLKRDREAR